MDDGGQAQGPGDPGGRRERFSVPHREGATMEVGEPIHVGGPKPWLCVVKLLARRDAIAAAAAEGKGEGAGSAGDAGSSEEPPSTLLLRTGRGATANEARRDALAQLSLVYGSPMGPPPEARISHLDVEPPRPPPRAASWWSRWFGRGRAKP